MEKNLPLPLCVAHNHLTTQTKEKRSEILSICWQGSGKQRGEWSCTGHAHTPLYLPLPLSLAHNHLTIQSYNGKEFTKHESIAKNLDAQFFFAHPYASWERGLNENTKSDVFLGSFICRTSELNPRKTNIIKTTKNHYKCRSMTFQVWIINTI